MSRFDTSALTRADIAALRGLAGGLGNDIAALNQERAQLQQAINAAFAADPSLRARAPQNLVQLQPGEPGHSGTPANLASITRITQRLRALVQWINANRGGGSGGGGGGGGGGSSGGGGGNVAALNQERAQLQQAINAAFAADPSLRARAPQNLVQLQPGEPGHSGTPANLASITRITQRLRALVQWINANRGGGGGGGSSGGGINVAALNQERAQLQALINTLAAQNPGLLQRAPANLRTVQPGEPGYNGAAPTAQGIAQLTARLRALVQWMQANAQGGPGGYANILPTPTRATSGADYGTNWGSTDAAAGDSYSLMIYGAGSPVSTYGGRFTSAADFGPQYASSALPCGLGDWQQPGMGSWLSSAFKSITGSRLSDVVPSLASNIPVVGGVVANILSSQGGTTDINAITQQILAALTPQQRAQINVAEQTGEPCQYVPASAQEICRVERARLADKLKQLWGAPSGASGACAHLPADQRVRCIDQRKAGWRLIAAALANGAPPADATSPIASLPIGPVTDADRAIVSSTPAAAASRGSSAIVPAAIGAALLLMGGR